MNIPFIAIFLLLLVSLTGGFCDGGRARPVTNGGRDVYLEIMRDSGGAREALTAPYAVAETLNFSGVDMQSRGPGGVQSDLSIRGSGFEQPRILLDGIVINDPQTGHHNMDLPLPAGVVSAIRVDRTRGGGTVELLTGKPSRGNLSLGVSYGGFSASGAELYGYLPAGGAGYLIGASRARSDGYFLSAAGRSINDYDISSFFTKVFTGSRNPFAPKTVYAGYTAKAFGAYDFYTPYRNFPSRENTKAEFLRTDFAPADGVSTVIYLRRHKDVFILKDTNPDLYNNTHTSLLGGALAGFSSAGSGLTFEGVYESIDSTGTKGGLGNHGRSRVSARGYLDLSIIGADVMPGLKTEYNDFYGSTEILPEFNVSKKVSGSAVVRISANRSYRLPSYTELYYEDVVNKGDSSLKKESSWNYTLGTDFTFGGFLSAVSCDFFVRDEFDLIDWVETQAGSKKYNAINVGSIRRQGAELRAAAKVASFTLSAGYNYTENDVHDYALTARNSKYALRNPQHYVFSGIKTGMPFGVTGSLDAAYKDRKDEKPYTVVSANLGRKAGNAEVSVRIANLLDEIYEEIPGVVEPGRSAELKISYRIF